MTPDEYEEFVRHVLQSMEDGGRIDVHHRQHFTGRVSGREIIIDVSFETEVFGTRLLFLVECKRYSERVSVDDVEEFHSKLDDIGAHKGLMVTTVGYQNGAIKTAKGRGIALALLTDEMQPGELIMVCNSRDFKPPEARPEDVFRGNLRSFYWPSEGPEHGGVRFNSCAEMVGMLINRMPEYRRLLYEHSMGKKPPSQ